MPTGTVKQFDGAKGYGFITPDAGGPDVFVHVSAVQRAGLAALHEGQRLRFESEDRGGKVAALNLQLEG